MKKRIFLAAALIGSLLTTTSCLDDKESPSVEAVRNAKAEQLKSIAALNNAEAEATKLLAEANAALIAAKTEAKQLDAALTEIEKQIKEIQLEKEKLALKLQQETFNMELAVEMQKLENQLAGLKNDAAEIENKKQLLAQQFEIAQTKLEAQLAQAKVTLLQAQDKLKDQLVTADENAAIRLNKIVGNYTSAVENLNDAKAALLGAERQKSRLEYDLLDTTIDEFIAGKTVSYYTAIADNNIRIQHLEQHAKYTESLNVDAWKQELQEAYQTRHFLAEEVNVKRYIYMNNSPEVPYISAFVENNPYIQANQNLGYNLNSGDFQTYQDYQDFIDVARLYNSLYEQDYENPYVYDFDNDFREDYEKRYYYKYVAVSLNQTKLATFVPAFENRIDEVQERYDDNKEYLDEQYEAAVEARKAAKKAWDDEAAETNPDADEVERLANVYRNALDREESWKDAVNYLIWDLERVKQNMADLKVLMSSSEIIKLNNVLAEYNAIYYTAYEQEEELYLDWLLANRELIALQTQIDVLEWALNNDNKEGADWSANQINDRIADLKASNEANQTQIDKWESAGRRESIEARRQAALDLQIIEVGLRKDEVQAAQINADAAKAAMDDAFAEYEK